MATLVAFPAYAEPPLTDLQVAERVMDEAIALYRSRLSKNAFEDFVRTTAEYTAVFCWNELAAEHRVPPRFKESPSRGGTFITPRDRRICDSVAKLGIHPVCTYGELRIIGVPRTRAWPPSYLLLSSKRPTLEVDGILACYLTEEQINPQWFRADHYKVRLLGPVAQTELMTRSGMRVVPSTTVEVLAPGVPGLEGEALRLMFRAVQVD